MSSMRRTCQTILFLLLILFLNSGIEIVHGAESTPQVEYVMAVIDSSTSTEFSSKLFIAFSSGESADEPAGFTVAGLPFENIEDIKVTDYLFFEQRYLRPINKYFLDDDSARFYIRKQNQQVETLAIFLFEQPFWSMQMAFKLPTSFLEWQLSLRERFAGHDSWPRVFSAADTDLPTDITFEKTIMTNKPGFNISYFIPQKDDKLTTRGVMFEYRERIRSNEDIKAIIERILDTEIRYTNTGQRLQIPIARFFIKSRVDAQNIILEPKAGLEVENETLTHRIGSKEKGVFFNSKEIRLNDDNLQRFEISINPPEDNLPIYAGLIETLDNERFPPMRMMPNRPDAALKAAKIVLIGLIAWILLFIVFHWNVLKGKNLINRILLAISSYFIYLAISTVFLFMFGFSFALGIVGMEAMVRRYSRNIHPIKLLACGLLTSVFTAFVIYIVCPKL